MITSLGTDNWYDSLAQKFSGLFFAFFIKSTVTFVVNSTIIYLLAIEERQVLRVLINERIKG